MQVARVVSRVSSRESWTVLGGDDAPVEPIERYLASPVADLVAAGDALETRWDGLTADLKGKVVDELMTVTILKAPRGTKGFRNLLML